MPTNFLFVWLLSDVSGGRLGGGNGGAGVFLAGAAGSLDDCCFFANICARGGAQAGVEIRRSDPAFRSGRVSSISRAIWPP